MLFFGIDTVPFFELVRPKIRQREMPAERDINLVFVSVCQASIIEYDIIS